MSKAAPAGCVFLAAFAVAMAVRTAELASIDEAYVFRAAESLACRGTLRFADAIDRRDCSRFAPAWSAWLAPWIAAGEALRPRNLDAGPWRIAAAQLGAAAWFGLTAAAMFGWLATRLPERLAAGAALAYALATPALLYGGALFHQNFAAGALVAALWASELGGGKRLAAAFALLAATQLNAVALLPAFALAAGSWRQRGWLAVGAGLGAAAAVGTNLLRGDPAIAGAYPHETFTTPLAEGLFGQLFSPGKGLLWWCPLALAGLAAAAWQAWRGAGLLLGIAATHLALTAGWWAWHGSHSAGPRLLAPLLPALVVAAARLWQDAPALRRPLLLATAASAALAWDAGLRNRGDLVLIPAGVSHEHTLFLPSFAPSALPRGPAPPVRWAWLATAGAAACALAISRRMPSVPLRAGARAGLAMAAAVALAGAPTWWPPPPGWRTVGGERRSLLALPLRGFYRFDGPPELLAGLRLGGRAMPIEAGAVTVETHVAHEVELAIPAAADPAALRWTLPGASQCQAAIPAAYLLPHGASAWRRALIAWRHGAAALWLLAAAFAWRWCGAERRR